MTNKRRRYRVRPASREELTISAARPGKEPIPGRIVDVSLGGVGVFFDQWRGATFALKEQVSLELTSASLAKPLLVPGLVRRRAAVQGGQLYGFEFVNWVGLLAQLPRPLAKLFNQRGDLRVKPDPASAIAVLVEKEYPRIKMEATLRDISSNGISVSAPYTVENLLLSERSIKVTFFLPTPLAKLVFWGSVLHRSLGGRGISYGILFDKEKTPQFQKKQGLVVEYINERRRQTLTRSAPGD
jgi:hypothetical protein